ncbi:liver carboxylesterase 1-like [Paramacrobiotus metropolitanus]|uniref:liver carboxylesterase 1-like n=1 Tax=Paramacrobiotus metropolitanus TaxID=2943436 RepID=UPI0024464293|nr:liver carboxylesterase 1-like [Paramacrobiotus metropolitanus]
MARRSGGTVLITTILHAIIHMLLSTYGATSEAQGNNQVHLTSRVTLLGEAFYSRTDVRVIGHSYYGIRYGTAKRFEHATENTDFAYLHLRPANINGNGSRSGAVCLQATGTGMIASSNHGPVVMDEDCLFLDVHVPVLSEDAGELPVIMYIHGGALQAGDKDIFNGSTLSAEVQAIVVGISYRLTVFGWLSTGDAALPGNYGLGDCKLALKWVIKHIRKFGGDPRRITVAGHSAGSMLTSALYMDPDYRGLMKAAISLSGSVLLERMLIRHPRTAVLDLATKTGCPNGTSEAAVECLKKASAEKLLRHSKRVVKGDPDLVPYGFVIDQKHFKKAPRQVIAEEPAASGAQPTLVTGFTKEDFSLLITITDPDYMDPTKPLEWKSLRESVARWYLPLQADCALLDYELAERVMQYYNISETDERADMLLKYIHLTSDALFGYPAAKEAFLYAQKGFPSQVYVMSHNPHFSNFGAFHAMELGYIFGAEVNAKMLNLTLHVPVQKSIYHMLRQVVHKGRTDGPLFGEFGKYIDLNQNGTWEEGTADFKGLVAFWDSVVTSNCRTANQSHNEL